MKYRLSEIVAKFGGELVGEDIEVSKILPTDLANDGDITFLSDKKYKKMLATCKASAIIISKSDAEDVSMPKIITDNPYFYFAQVSNLFNPEKRLKLGISANACVSDIAVIGLNPAIANNVVIGDAKIGNDCQLYPNVVIGDNVVIGNNVKLYPNVTIYDGVNIGDNVTIHSSTTIGADGFGNAQNNQRHYLKIPQIGGVTIGNNVEIGANTTIDSGTFSPTIIEDGVRIDNLVQIAHNVKIGAHTGIAANVGIAGGTTIGKYCMLAGGAGITGHVTIADYTVIGGASNVGKDILEPGLYSGTFVAEPYKEWARTVVNIRNLSKLQARVKELEQKIGDNK